jgi:2-hydroxy-4-(methylsulfanyl)butanoate S-methyltransferase
LAGPEGALYLWMHKQPGARAMASDPSPEPLPITIRRHSVAVYLPMAMLAGMQLDVFTPLKDGPLGAEPLADALGVDSRRLRRLLYALVNAELLTVENGRFANTPEAERFLVRGRPAYMGGMHELWSDLWSATLRTAESVRTGLPQAKHDFEAMAEAELGAFLRGLHPSALAGGRALAPALGLERYQTLLDVGGGCGGTAIGACEAVPHLRATVVELPSITPFTHRFVVEAGMSGRIDVESADLVNEPPRGAF